MLKENHSQDSNVLINALQDGEIDLIRSKDLVLFSTETVDSDYYGSHVIRLIGVEIPYLFNSDKKWERYCEKNMSDFPVWKRTPLVITLKRGEGLFPCEAIWTIVREDNKGWNYKGTEYERDCVDSKPSKHLPIAVTEKALQRFLDKFPELVIGLEKYNEALKFLREDYLASSF